MKQRLIRLLEDERFINRLGWTVFVAWMLIIGSGYGFIIRAIIHARRNQ